MTQLNTRIGETRGEDLSAFFDYICKEIGDLAVKSLLYEVSTTPKPGLVDRENNGAHTDMCFETFLDSAAALRDCFEECCRAGTQARTCGSSLPELAVKLRKTGQAGENDMFAATGGINTHKGLIFSLGIICGAAGLIEAGLAVYQRKSGKVDRGTARVLQEVCAAIAAELLYEEPEETDNTNGKKVLKSTGIGGIRAEALSGFDSAFSKGLPALKRALDEGCSMNIAMVRTLIELMACVDDSNVVHRGGIAGMDFVRKRAGEILASGDDWWKDEALQVIRDFDAQCIDMNLSPGGCADLLAISVMLFYLEKRGIL